MCYSAESSIISFIIGAGCSLYLLNSKNNTNKHIGLFFLFVSLIQFLEFLMWIDQDCGILNNIASKSILFVLSSQLFVIIFGFYIFKTSIIDDRILKIILMIILIPYLYIAFKSYFIKEKWCSKPNRDRSMQWQGLQNSTQLETYIYYTVFFVSPFFVKELWKSIILFITGLISFFSTRYKNSLTSNSRWCYYSAFIPILFVILDYNNL